MCRPTCQFIQECVSMATSVQQPEPRQDAPGHFPPNGNEPPAPEYMAVILESLQTMKNGDFSVRLPVAWTGLAGENADKFYEIVATNEQMAFELKRVGQAGWEEGKTPRPKPRARRRGARGRHEMS